MNLLSKMLAWLQSIICKKEQPESVKPVLPPAIERWISSTWFEEHCNWNDAVMAVEYQDDTATVVVAEWYHLGWRKCPYTFKKNEIPPERLHSRFKRETFI